MCGGTQVILAVAQNGVTSAARIPAAPSLPAEIAVVARRFASSNAALGPRARAGAGASS